VSFVDNKVTRPVHAILALLAVAATSCGTSAPAPQPSAAVTTARTVAQEFVDGYYHQFPDEAYEVGYPDTPMDRLGDRGEVAMTAWRASEDGWLATLTKINPAQLEGTDATVPYAFTRHRLEASIARRVCRTTLWIGLACSRGKPSAPRAWWWTRACT
jgi:uncharacterized protein (DUF885 family)